MGEGVDQSPATKKESPPPSFDASGRPVLGSPLTAPDLVMCRCSPEINGEGSLQKTPEFIKKWPRRNRICFKDDLPEKIMEEPRKEQSLSPSAMALALVDVNSPKTYGIEFQEIQQKLQNGQNGLSEVVDKRSGPLICINSGGNSLLSGSSSSNFDEDAFFSGGEVIRTDDRIGEEEGPSVYQTARFGDFSYKFNLHEGDYIVDLHFAEIVFLNGPAGLRVFNVFIQDDKVLSNIDIYALIGPNKPLVFSDLRASVEGDAGLTIRFEQVSGTPLICGICVWKNSPQGQAKASNGLTLQAQTNEAKQELLVDKSNECTCNAQRQVSKLKKEYEKLWKEQEENKRASEELKKENEFKDRECQEAWMSLQELQNELMRKSMHVGSLAFAVEGQVKEKSLWFSSLKEISEKVKLLKLEHQKLLEEALDCNRCFKDVAHVASDIQSTVSRQANLEREHEELKAKFIKATNEQKQLYNKIVEMKGNIRVFCRCRPLNKEEIEAGASIAVDFESAKDGELTVKTNGGTKKLYKFDAVFSPQADQAEVFEDTAPFAASVLDGYNVCIFAYGQTGTGKTFTMEGTDEARGVNYRTLDELFRLIGEREGLFKYELSVSVLEVYNEQIRDLLASTSQPGQAAKRLEIRQVADGVHHVPGLAEAQVNNMNEVWEVLQTGSNARAIGSTNANEHSSRSHCIHCVTVRGENLMNGECTRSKLWLVDLAGSERLAKTDVQGERLKEAQNINKSLSALGDVVSSLATKSPHIPYRNSKLTHLLQDSLGGDSKTLMVLQISPNENDVNETLCSLNFASRVRGVELGPARKQMDTSELCKYKQMVEKTKQDIKAKDGQIKKMEDTILSLGLKMRARDSSNKSLQDRIKELEAQLVIERKLSRQHIDSKVAEHQSLQQQAMKPPLPVRQLGNHRGATFVTGNELFPLCKDLLNVMQPLSENNHNIKQQDSLMDSNPGGPKQNLVRTYSTPIQKENKVDIIDQQPIVKRTGRASICTTAQRIPMVPVPRRTSLIPLPSIRNGLPLLPFTTPQPSRVQLTPLRKIDPIEESTPCSFRGSRNNRRPSIVLRRSIQMKVKLKSPLYSHKEMDKARASIGGRLRQAQRVLVSDVRGTKLGQQRQQDRVKQRGWNHGASMKKLT